MSTPAQRPRPRTATTPRPTSAPSRECSRSPSTRAVVWYSPDLTGPELERIRSFYGEDDVGDRVIVAPYDYPDQGAAGSLPGGTQMALVAWHHVQTCARVNLAAAFGFTSTYAAPPFGEQRYRGNAPEAGGAF